MRVWRLLVFTFLVSDAIADVVLTEQGHVNGTILHSRGGRPFYAFYGIPYAQPPVGELRFQPPQKPDKWHDVRQATIKGPICLQDNFFGGNADKVQGQEDCLYISVFTTKIKSKLPVIVYIHGGAYRRGSADFRGPHFFMDHDIVFVTFNYRVGVLGYLSAEDNVLSGNFGLKDQVAALKWVQENIANFGGDPDSVTLLGQSSGAASVHLHTLSPASKGLFHRVTIQSGTAHSLWSHFPKNKAAGYYKQLAEHANCLTDNTKETLQCLQQLPAEEFIKLEDLVWCDMVSIVRYRPTIEGPGVEDPFLTGDPRTLPAQDTSIPWIIGFTSSEGIFELKNLLSTGIDKKYLGRKHRDVLPSLLHYHYFLNADDTNMVSERLKQFYIDKSDDRKENEQDLCNMLSDLLFSMGAIDCMLRYSGTKYVYYFDYDHDISITKHLFNHPYPETTVKGAAHSEDLTSLFSSPLEKFFTDDHKHFSEKLVSYWTTFAQTGNPNRNDSSLPVWQPMKTENIEYLHFSNSHIKMQTSLLKDRHKFWQSLPL